MSEEVIEIHLTVAQKQELIAANTKQQTLVLGLGQLAFQRHLLDEQMEKMSADLAEAQRAFAEKMKAVVSMGGGALDGAMSFDFSTGVIKVKKAGAPLVPPDEKHPALN